LVLAQLRIEIRATERESQSVQRGDDDFFDDLRISRSRGEQEQREHCDPRKNQDSLLSAHLLWSRDAETTKLRASAHQRHAERT